MMKGEPEENIVENEDRKKKIIMKKLRDLNAQTRDIKRKKKKRT